MTYVDEHGIQRRYCRDDKISVLECSVRTYNVMDNAGIKTLGDVLDLPEDQFRRFRNVGVKTLKEFVDLQKLIRQELLTKYTHFPCGGALVEIKDQSGMYMCMKCSNFLVHPQEYPHKIDLGAFAPYPGG